MPTSTKWPLLCLVLFLSLLRMTTFFKLQCFSLTRERKGFLMLISAAHDCFHRLITLHLIHTENGRHSRGENLFTHVHCAVPLVLSSQVDQLTGGRSVTIMKNILHVLWCISSFHVKRLVLLLSPFSWVKLTWPVIYFFCSVFLTSTSSLWHLHELLKCFHHASKSCWLDLDWRMHHIDRCLQFIPSTTQTRPENNLKLDLEQEVVANCANQVIFLKCFHYPICLHLWSPVLRKEKIKSVSQFDQGKCIRIVQLDLIKF